MIGLTVFVGTTNVIDYFRWQGRSETQVARMPGVDYCEFGLWQKMAHDAAKQGEGIFVNRADFDRERRKLDCSEIVHDVLASQPPVTAR
jgi:hypothetical protein